MEWILRCAPFDSAQGRLHDHKRTKRRDAEGAEKLRLMDWSGLQGTPRSLSATRLARLRSFRLNLGQAAWQTGNAAEGFFDCGTRRALRARTAKRRVPPLRMTSRAGACRGWALDFEAPEIVRGIQKLYAKLPPRLGVGALPNHYSVYGLLGRKVG